MLRIRLRRVGRKHDPSYQLIVAEKGRGPQTGDYVEKVGTYDARSDEYELKGERIEYWMSEGAKPTDTVHNLLVQAGIVDDETVNPLPKKSPIMQEEEGDQKENESDNDETQANDEEGSEDDDDTEEGDDGDDGEKQTDDSADESGSDESDDTEEDEDNDDEE